MHFFCLNKPSPLILHSWFSFNLQIDREREGEDIDQALVKNVLAVYVDVGQGSLKYYEKDFEEAMFEDTAAFYSTKASKWIKNESYKNYMLKVSIKLPPAIHKYARRLIPFYALDDDN